MNSGNNNIRKVANAILKLKTNRAHDLFQADILSTKTAVPININAVSFSLIGQNYCSQSRKKIRYSI